MKTFKHVQMLKCLDVKMKGGFTLLEVIIAVFLITVGITGAFFVINKTISLMAVHPSKLVAAYLAQEGMEIVRNIRDTNWVEAAIGGWDEDLPEGSWEADYRTQALIVAYGAHFLKIDGNGFYHYNFFNGPEETKFQRRITISDKVDLTDPPDGISDKMTVKVEIFWTEKGKSESVAVEENLYDWH